MIHYRVSALQSRNIQLPLLEFVRLVARRIAQLRLAQTAASLASLSLLALVPVLSMGFWVLALSPSFGRLRDVFLKLLEQLMLPTVSSTVVKYLNQFATRGADLPIVGILGFLLTAILALSTVEKTIHLIWQVPNRRSWWRRLWLYGVILAGGPLLIATGFALTVGLGSPLVEFFIQSLTNTRQERRELSSALNFIWPFALSCFALTWAYRMVPSVPVRWLAALLGGFVSTVLISVLKIALSWYFTAFPSFKTVYGTLATLPILLLWLNAMWLIILVGAIVVASIEGFQEHRIARRWLPVSLNKAGMDKLSSSKVMSAQELFDVAVSIRAELLGNPQLKQTSGGTFNEGQLALQPDRWIAWRDLKSIRSLHPVTAKHILGFLVEGQFIQVGRVPGSAFDAPIQWTFGSESVSVDSLALRWSSVKQSNDDLASVHINEIAALKEFVWNGKA
jgi:YihY family inner membrane protein